MKFWQNQVHIQENTVYMSVKSQIVENFRFDHDYEFDYEYDLLIEIFRFDYECEFDYEYTIS